MISDWHMGSKLYPNFKQKCGFLSLEIEVSYCLKRFHKYMYKYFQVDGFQE